MIHEFAVDPEAICNFENFRYVVDQCGLHKGRLISRFPGKWKKLVYEACKEWYSKQEGQEVKFKSIIDRLKKIDDKLIRRNREYIDGNNSWIFNAIEQHKLLPFRAIISIRDTEDCIEVLCVDSLSESIDLWEIPRDTICKRKPIILAKQVETIFRVSKEVLFIDPHFDPTASRFRSSLKEFIKAACNVMPQVERIEYHLLDPDDMSIDDFKSYCNKLIKCDIPSGEKLKFVLWRKKLGGDAIHARYILTEKGGIGYDYGLDEADGTHVGETTDVRLLDMGVYQERWDSFQKSADVYDLIDEFEIIG